MGYAPLNSDSVQKLNLCAVSELRDETQSLSVHTKRHASSRAARRMLWKVQQQLIVYAGAMRSRSDAVKVPV